MLSFAYLACVLLWYPQKTSSIISKGLCSEVYKAKAAHMIDVKRLEGTWYEFARYEYPMNHECSIAKFTLYNRTSLRFIFAGHKFHPKVWHKLTGLAIFPNPRRRAELNFEVDDIPDNVPKDIEEVVLNFGADNPKYVTSVDYDNYFILWMCTQWLPIDSHSDECYIYTRKPLPADENNVRHKILNDFRQIKPDEVFRLDFIDHDNCSYIDQ